MDEAVQLGLGNYLKDNGYKRARNWYGSTVHVFSTSAKAGFGAYDLE